MINPEVVIEPFNGDQAVADAVAAHHLAVRLRQMEEGESDFHGRIHSSQSDLRGMQENYVEAGGNFFIARDVNADEIAGFIGLRKTGEGEGSIKRMAVLPAYRRQRIGTRLAQTAVSWARDAGFTRLKVATGQKEKAITIYKSVGFKLTGQDEKRGDILLSLDLT